MKQPPEPRTLDETALRRAFAAFATGVTVVTVADEPHGMTANSFTSVSLNPPLILVCVERKAIMHRAITRARTFGVSVLAADQRDVAKHFANRRRPLGWAQFDVVAWQAGPLTGAPLIGGALAHFECERWRTYDGGDHTVFLGRVLSAERDRTADALLYVDSGFHQLVAERSEVTP